MREPNYSHSVTNATEVSLDELLSLQPSTSIPVLDPLVDSLPYRKLSWQLFESLCAHLLNEADELKVRQAFRYGREGQDQAGIDIIAVSTDGPTVTVAECKRYRDVTKGQLRVWIESFLAGRWAKQSRKYILCLATTVKDTKVTDIWLDMSERCRIAGIEAELWDAAEIDRRLRKHPGIVTQFFGRQYAERFCTNARRDDIYPTRFRARYRSKSGSDLLLENESIAVSFNLPSEQYPHFGALFSFARTDLTGISLSVAGDLLVRWLQWRAWSTSDATDRPYADASTWVPGRYVLATRSTRLTLTREEVEHLDWIFTNAWSDFLTTAHGLVQKWRALQYKRIERSDVGFSIASLRRRDWSALLAFANEHDYAQGNTEQHIFDRSAGMIKVYVENQSHGLNPGYHLILRAFDDWGMVAAWERSLDLVWEPMTDIASQPMKAGPSDAWDAEYTHNWVLNTLCKWVEEWVTRCREESAKTENSGWFKQLGRKQERPQPFKLDVSSNARLPKHGIGVARTPTELAAEASYYQMHFGRNDLAPVSSDMIEAVLTLVRRHLSHAKDGGRAFIASKLHMDEQSLEQGIDQLLGDKSALRAWTGDLDLALRCLLQILRDAPALPPAESEYAAHLLRPLAERVKEDLVCDVFSMVAVRQR